MEAALGSLTASSLSVCKSGRRTHEGAISMHTTSSETANQNSAVKLIMRAAAAAAKVDTDNGQATVSPLVTVFTLLEIKVVTDIIKQIIIKKSFKARDTPRGFQPVALSPARAR